MNRPRAAKTAAPRPTWYSVPEAAERFGVHEKTLYRLIRDGKSPVPAYLIGGTTRIKVVDVDAFLRERDAD